MRRLRNPVVRALGWLAVVVVLAAVLMAFANMHEVMGRMEEAPDLRYAAAGSVLTAIVAAMAAFELSVPGRSGWWMAAPIPPAVLWFAASGWGCLRDWDWPGLHPATMHDAMGCVQFITLVSPALVPFCCSGCCAVPARCGRGGSRRWRGWRRQRPRPAC